MSITPANLELDADGIPRSAAFDDVYHTRDGGLGQARAVFMAGNNLPARWQGRAHFTILETGFGLGLNFLATWQAWRADPHRSNRLHFVSVEKYPFTAADLARLHAAWPELADMSAQLVAQWPLLTPGFHRLHLDAGQVVLTLLLGDAHTCLPQVDASVDAFYLDGFSPAKNPELWNEQLYRQCARLAATEATVATYTVASAVRQGLLSVGFRTEKRPGFGRKRDRLEGVFAGQRRGPAINDKRKVVVVGAGLAGSSVARALAERGWAVSVWDEADGPAKICSGNPVGAALPVMSLDDNRQSRLSRAALLYLNRHVARLRAQGQVVDMAQTGVLHLASDDADALHQQKVVSRLSLPADFVRWVNASEASQLCGQTSLKGGWWFAQGAWAHPASVVRANLQHPAIIATYRRQLLGLEPTAQGGWTLHFEGGTEEAPVVVLANAVAASSFGPTRHLPLSAAWRQLSCLPEGLTAPLQCVVCGEGYLTPAWNGVRVAGSAPAQPGVVAVEGHALNLAQAEGLLPGSTRSLQPEQVGGRTSFRPASPDRLPLLGAVADMMRFDLRRHTQPWLMPRLAGLYVASGFGARGVTWSALAGEIVASAICGEPAPVERDLLFATDPARFLMRQAGKS